MFVYFLLGKWGLCFPLFSLHKVDQLQLVVFLNLYIFWVRKCHWLSVLQSLSWFRTLPFFGGLLIKSRIQEGRHYCFCFRLHKKIRVSPEDSLKENNVFSVGKTIKIWLKLFLCSLISLKQSVKKLGRNYIYKGKL